MSTNAEHRTLAAIIFTDMGGYSLLPFSAPIFEPRSLGKSLMHDIRLPR